MHDGSRGESVCSKSESESEDDGAGWLFCAVEERDTRARYAIEEEGDGDQLSIDSIEGCKSRRRSREEQRAACRGRSVDEQANQAATEAGAAARATAYSESISI